MRFKKANFQCEDESKASISLKYLLWKHAGFKPMQKSYNLINAYWPWIKDCIWLFFFFCNSRTLLTAGTSSWNKIGLPVIMAGVLSKYELLRLRNIKRNHEFMKSLGKCFISNDEQAIFIRIKRLYFFSITVKTNKKFALDWICHWFYLVPVAVMGKEIWRLADAFFDGKCEGVDRFRYLI